MRTVREEIGMANEEQREEEERNRITAENAEMCAPRVSRRIQKS